MNKRPDEGSDRAVDRDPISDESLIGSGPVAPAQKPVLQKVTLYVRPEQTIQLEEIQLRERRRTGTRPDKSALVQEALDLLAQKYSKPE
jgi:hypothetical protein